MMNHKRNDQGTRDGGHTGHWTEFDPGDTEAILEFSDPYTVIGVRSQVIFVLKE